MIRIFRIFQKNMNKRQASLLGYLEPKKSKVSDNQTVTTITSQETTFETPSTSHLQENLGSNLDPELEIPENDISRFVKSQEASSNLLSKLENIWEPEKTFKFPGTSFGKFERHFQWSWLSKYKWLAYSKVTDAAYCKFCVLSKIDEVGHNKNQNAGKLVSGGYNNWKNAVEAFNHHSVTDYHKKSVLRISTFKCVLENKMLPITKQLDKAKADECSKNRKILSSIIKAIIFCGRQGISLRGHRDFGPFDFQQRPTENEGNFRALLRHRIDAGDEVLSTHFLKCKKNATYISWNIQNQIINKCSDFLQELLVAKIKHAKYFSILADETTDISTVEQFSLCVRYVDEDKFKICENFLMFHPLASTTGEELSNQIINNLKGLGINIEYMRGQGYDGAGAMSGKFIGTQARMLNFFPKALYVHCMSHSLNLAISASCDVQDIRNCLGIIEKIYVFFKTPQRQQVLDKNIDKICPDSKKSGLKKVCPTRWVERHDAVSVFTELIHAVFASLEDISLWVNKDTSSSARTLLLSISDARFIIALYVIEKLFSYTVKLSQFLQTVNTDIVKALGYIESITKSISNLRQNSETEFKSIFDKVKEICEKYEINIKIPRITKTQIYRYNVESSNPEQYYRISIFIPFADHLLAQLESRFLKHKDILSSFSCLFPKGDHNKTENLENFTKLCEFYQSDVDENGGFVTENLLKSEYMLWIEEYKIIIHNAGSDKYQSPIDLLAYINKQIYPNIYLLVKIFCTIPVTTATTERSFSTLRRLKTYLRNSMSENRLTGLALLNIYYEMDVDPEKIIDRLAQEKRRLDFDI